MAALPLTKATNADVMSSRLPEADKRHVLRHLLSAESMPQNPCPSPEKQVLITSRPIALPGATELASPAVDDVLKLINRPPIAPEPPLPRRGGSGTAPTLSRKGSHERSAAPCALHFERVFKSFRIKLFDLIGPRYDELVMEAERRVRFLQPEFDLNDLTDKSSPAVLELIEELVRRAPLLKRARLRKLAALLVADLYEKQYDLLEKAEVLQKVEEAYYRLKR